MKLLQLVAGQIRLHQTLPWNVRTARGQLLLGKGQVIDSEARLAALLERGMFVDHEEYERSRHEPPARGADPLDAWEDLLRRAALLLREPQDPEFAPRIRALAQQLDDQALRDADLACFQLLQAERIGYPVLHSVQTAFLCALVCKRLGLPAGERRTAVGAALTMNLSMLELQAVLAVQPHPPTEPQLAQLLSHPQRSRDLLEQAGIEDPEWLQAVLHHHRRADGGYPPLEGEVPRLAQVLLHADVYLAKLAARRTRAALPPHEAARAFFVAAGGVENPIAAAVVKEMGLYPPGTYVKLACGETAVVARRGDSATTPLVYSLANGEGIPFAEPVRRDTRQERFRIALPVAPSNVLVRFDAARLFASD